LGCRPHKQSNLLIINVRIFDVVNERLIKSANVLIEGNLIRQVATKKIVSDLATVIDVGGRPLVPGDRVSIESVDDDLELVVSSPANERG